MFVIDNIKLTLAILFEDPRSKSRLKKFRRHCRPLLFSFSPTLNKMYLVLIQFGNK